MSTRPSRLHLSTYPSRILVANDAVLYVAKIQFSNGLSIHETRGCELQNGTCDHALTLRYLVHNFVFGFGAHGGW